MEPGYGYIIIPGNTGITPLSDCRTTYTTGSYANGVTYVINVEGFSTLTISSTRTGNYGGHATVEGLTDDSHDLISFYDFGGNADTRQINVSGYDYVMGHVYCYAARQYSFALS